jgi:hypothetical protein
LIVVVGNTNAKTAATRKIIRLSNESRTVSDRGQVWPSFSRTCFAFDHGDATVLHAFKQQFFRVLMLGRPLDSLMIVTDT